MTKVLEYYCVSHLGNLRDNHEDNFLTCDGELISLKQQKQLTQKSPQIIIHKAFKGDKVLPAVFVVADGMGGYNAGEIASNTVVVELNKKIKSGRGLSDSGKSPTETIVQYINEVNSLVNLKAGADDNLSGMGSTIAALVFEENGVSSINVGDSRTYLFENRALSQLSHDHTFGQQICDMGLANEVNLDLVAYRKSLTRFVGMESGPSEDITKVSNKVAYGDSQIYMICSDGLTDEIPQEIIAGIFANGGDDLNKIGEALLSFALGGNGKDISGRDNVTFILIKLRNA